MLSPHQVRLRQGGAALLLMLLTLIIFAGTFVVYSSDDAEEIQISKREQTARALAEAKEKLLAFILIDAVTKVQATPRIGEFPCPDTDNNGDSEGGGACQDIGWFPWKTLELEDLRDSSDSRLWYAVAPDFQDDGNSEPQLNSLTWDTIGHFRVEDINAVQHRVAAVIIAPGTVLPQINQTRTGNDAIVANVIDNYLEGENGDEDDLFREPVQPGENDQMVYITVDEVEESVTNFAMRSIAGLLRDYYNNYGFYPFPEFDTLCDNLTAGSANKAAMLPLTRNAGCPYPQVLDMPDWFTYSTIPGEDGQGWDDLVVYMAAPACAGNGTANCNGGGGLLALNAQGGIQAMIVDPGLPLDDTLCNGLLFDQTRPRVKLMPGSAPPADRLCQFLDTTESTNNDLIFTEPVVSTTVNDRFLIISP